MSSWRLHWKPFLYFSHVFGWHQPQYYSVSMWQKRIACWRGLFLLNILECISALEVVTHKFTVLDFRIISKFSQLSLLCLHCAFHVDIGCCFFNFVMKIICNHCNLLGPSVNQHISNPFGLLNVHKYSLFLWLSALWKCWAQSITIHPINVC